MGDVYLSKNVHDVAVSMSRISWPTMTKHHAPSALTVSDFAHGLPRKESPWVLGLRSRKSSRRFRNFTFCSSRRSLSPLLRCCLLIIFERLVPACINEKTASGIVRLLQFDEICGICPFVHSEVRILFRFQAGLVDNRLFSIELSKNKSA